MMKSAFPFIIAYLFSALSVTAQNKADSNLAFDNALQAYHNFLKPETGLYNGREYINYAATLTEGVPYFEYLDLQDGTVVYDNVLYKNIPVLYDLVKKEIVISDSSHFKKMYLNNEMISAFSILTHNFIKLGDSLRSGLKPDFYEILYEGNNISLYKRQSKTIQERVGIITSIERYITVSEDYYIKKENKFFEVSSKGDVLKVLNDRKKELSQFIKKNKLKIKKGFDGDFVSAARYYDTIKQ